MQAPIVKIIVNDGKIAEATFYAPALPDGEHNLFVDPGDERIAELEKDESRLRGALERIHQWAQAYPLDVFPEPDFKAVAKALKDAGLSLDQVSASNMRHVITHVGDIASKAIGL